MLNRRTNRKWMLLLIAVLLVITTACGNSNPGSSETSGSNSGSQSSTPAPAESTEPAEPIELSIMTILFEPTAPTPEMPSLVRLQELTNTKLDVTFVPSQVFPDKVNATIASGEMSDLLLVTDLKSSSVVNAVRSGMFWELGPYFSEYPNLSKLNPLILNNSSIDGKTYALYRSREWVLARGGIIYRKDWLENVGLQPPKTIDELYQVFKAFTEQDPDGNGKHDTYGAGETNFITMNTIAPYFGVPNLWDVQDGKFVPDFMTSEYMELLKFMKRLYDEKLINQDFAAAGLLHHDHLNMGKSGLAFGTMDDITNQYNEIYSLFPDAELGLINRISGPKGERVYASAGFNGAFMVPKTSVKTEERLREVLQYLDASLSEEVMDFFTWGIDGRHSKVEDGAPVVHDQDLYNLEMQPIRQLMSGNQAIARPGKRLPLAMEALEKIDDNASIAIANPATPLISETHVERGGELQKLIDDAKVKFIMGQIDEAGWQASVDNWLKTGGSNIIDEYTKAYADSQ